MDYSVAARDRSILQSALDAGSLAGARALPTMTQTQARTLAESYARANLPARMRTVPLTTEVTSSGQGLRIAGTTTSPTGLLNIIGIRTLPVTADSAARAPSTRRIEAVLALDNTGSMSSSGKIEALRSAVLEFLNILENSGRPQGDVLVGIVPFATGVRVDPNVYRSSPGLYSTGDSWSPQASSWDGCIWDRNQPHDTRNTFPSDPSQLFPRLSCSSSGQAHLVHMRTLTSDFAALRQTANAMAPSGNTNVNIGLEWGWHLLTWNIAPPNPGMRTVPANTDRWIVVLTDGDNTQSRWGDNANGAIDTRTRATCTNLRSSETTVRVITIRVVEGNAGLLRDCATTSSDYYEVSNSSDIVDVFRRIAWVISSLRLTE
jgi:hypothetical protein